MIDLYKNTKWLLDANLYAAEKCYRDMEKIFQREGIEYKLVSADDCFNNLEFIKNIYPPEDCVLFCGNLHMGRWVHKNCHWVPSIYDTLEDYNCNNYFPVFKDYLLNYFLGEFIPFGLVKEKADYYFNKYTKTVGCLDDSFFIRPNTSNKLFTGQVFDRKNIDYELEFVKTHNHINDNEFVLVSPAMEIIQEYRCVVVNNNVITITSYGWDSKPYREEDLRLDDALRYAQLVVSKTQPRFTDRVWVLDLAHILPKDAKVCYFLEDYFRVLEVNSFSCAGMYDADPEIIVKEVGKAAYEDWLDANN